MAEMSAMLSMEPLPPLPDHLTWPREPLVDELHTLSLLDLPSWLVVDPAPEPWLVVDSAPKPVLTAIPKAPRTRRHSVKARRHVPLPPPPPPRPSTSASASRPRGSERCRRTPWPLCAPTREQNWRCVCALLSSCTMRASLVESRLVAWV